MLGSDCRTICYVHWIWSWNFSTIDTFQETRSKNPLWYNNIRSYKNVQIKFPIESRSDPMSLSQSASIQLLCVFFSSLKTSALSLSLSLWNRNDNRDFQNLLNFDIVSGIDINAFNYIKQFFFFYKCTQIAWLLFLNLYIVYIFFFQIIKNTLQKLSFTNKNFFISLKLKFYKENLFVCKKRLNTSTHWFQVTQMTNDIYSNYMYLYYWDWSILNILKILKYFFYK